MIPVHKLLVFPLRTIAEKRVTVDKESLVDDLLEASGERP